MPDPQSLAKGLMADGPVMRAYEPSWRDRMAAALMGDGRASPARAQVVMGLMGSRGLGPTGLSAVDATPAGAILDMQQAAQHGDKAGMAMAAAGFVPGAKVAGAVENQMRKYGVKDVEEAANMLADRLRQRGANVSVHRAESLQLPPDFNGLKEDLPPPKVSYYINNLNDPDHMVKDLGQIRISDHDGGWGNRRPAKQWSIDLSKNGGLYENELNSKFDEIINNHRHFYDPEGVNLEIQAKNAEKLNALNMKNQAAQKVYDEVMAQNAGHKRAHDRAIRKAREVYSNFDPRFYKKP